MANTRSRLLGSTVVPDFAAWVNSAPHPRRPTKSLVVKQGVWEPADNARGLVISQPITINGSSFSTLGGIDPDVLRSYALFWDRLDYPRSNLIEIAPGSDLEFLESAGVLRRTPVVFAGAWDGAEAVLQSHLSTFRRLDREAPGCWALATGPGALSFSDTELEQGRGLLFELASVIPVPSRDVHLADVLAFKERRKSELLALRSHLDDLYTAILAAPDRSLAKMSQFEGLDRTIADHIRVSAESGLSIKFVKPQAKLDLNAALAAGAAVSAAAQAHLPFTQVALAGLAGGAAKAFGSLGVTVGLKGGSARGTPFEYVIASHNEL